MYVIRKTDKATFIIKMITVLKSRSKNHSSLIVTLIVHIFDSDVL